MDRLKRAFTLVELMMVVLVICIMMSVLMPVLAKTRRRVLKVECMSNLRQIGMALSDYANSFDEFSPPAKLTDPYGHFLNYLFVENLEMKERSLQCPSTDADNTFNPYGGEGVYGELSRASYILNVIREKDVLGWSYLGARISVPYSSAFGWCTNSITEPVRRTRVAKPAEKIRITDSSPGLTNSAAALGIFRLHETDHGTIDSNENSTANAGERQVGYQHDLSFSALFGDMHVEARRSTSHEEWNAIQR